MTVRTLRSNKEESDAIVEDKLRFVIRSDKEFFKANDVIHFQCYEGKRPVHHANNKVGYVVTMIRDHMSAPIEKGYQIIGFRRIG